MADLGSSLDRTEAFIRAEGYRGYDPYDGLASPLFKLPVLNRAKIPRWGFQQIIKRLPFQIRPLLGISKGYNPVTLALCAQALTWRDMAAGENHDSRRDEVEKLVAELDRLRTPGYSGSCWGYDFHWQARYANIPAGHPTVVATGFITHALFTIWRHYRIERARELILDAAQFVLWDLHRTHHGDMFCWSYSPTDKQEVLNATMKGARLLAQAVSLGGDPVWLNDAFATIKYVVSRQSESGSWPYSIGDTRSWADHFHTCYNLDCIHEYQELSGDRTFEEPLNKGLDYYDNHFFTEDGIPKYYDQSTYPIDATCCGQALLTLMRFGRHEQAAKTAQWILSNMSLPNGGFKYQIHPRYENRLVYMRWSVAWIFAGLARLEQGSVVQGS
ncbi:MAG: delta-aminolevulinic acid dehydratase [Holophagae bacterium]|nr:delta-aminolevulinic acid dehydratase [Holophagae bacterium]